MEVSRYVCVLYVANKFSRSKTKVHPRLSGVCRLNTRLVVQVLALLKKEGSYNKRTNKPSLGFYKNIL